MPREKKAKGRSEIVEEINKLTAEQRKEFVEGKRSIPIKLLRGDADAHAEVIRKMERGEGFGSTKRKERKAWCRVCRRREVEERRVPEPFTMQTPLGRRSSYRDGYTCGHCQVHYDSRPPEPKR